MILTENCLKDVQNDLWMFDIETELWTWISGSDSGDQAGNNGMKGVSTKENILGARASHSMDMDSVNRDIHVFGGSSGSGGRHGNHDSVFYHPFI